MAFHRCDSDASSSSHRTMIWRKKKTTTTTILLTLMTMTVVGINDHVTCWPMIDSSPAWPTSSPSPSSSPSPTPSPPPPSSTSVSTSEELDSDTSRKVLGSSVVTSVSVVMNNSDGKSNTLTTPAVEPNPSVTNSTFSTGFITTAATNTATSTAAVSANKRVSLDDDNRLENAELKSNAIGSPGNFLNPDKYEFYTFDEAGDLVKRLMSWDEIQGLIAASDTDGLLGEAVVPIYYNENANGNGNAYIAVADKLHGTHLAANDFQSSDVQDVRKVVESVQNVLRSELAAAASAQSKIVPATAVKPSSLHLNSPNWSSLFLPNFLDNLDEDAFVDLQHHQDSLAITSPIRFPSPSDKIVNSTVAANTTTTSSAPVSQTRTTSALPAPAVTNDDVATPSAGLKFTRIKNTVTKPTNFKFSSSSPPNSIVSDEKPTKNYIQSSISLSPLTRTTTTSSTTSPSFFSSFSSYSQLPSSIPVKNPWLNKASPTSTAATTTSSPKITTVPFSIKNSTGPFYESSVTTTNRNAITAALTNLLNQMNQEQQQTVKIRPSSESLVHDSSLKTTTKYHYTNHHSTQHNSSATSNPNSVPQFDSEKNTPSHYQSSFKNTSTEKYFGGSQTVIATTPSFQYTRFNGFVPGNLATKTTSDQHQYVTYENSAEKTQPSSSSTTWAQSSLVYKSSPAPPTAETNSNSMTWKNDAINGTSATTTTYTAGKFSSFSPYRTSTTVATSAESVATIHTTASANNLVQELTPSSTTVEPLVTWISTNNFDDQRVDSKISNGQILDSDKLVTEQYVSGTASAAAVTNGQLVSFSKDTNRVTGGGEQFLSSSTNVAEPFTKRTTVWSTSVDGNSGKTDIFADGKKHTTQPLATATTATTIAMSQLSPSSSYLNRWPATASPPATNFVQQQTIPNRLNSINNIGNIESKTTIASNLKNNYPDANHHHHNHPQDHEEPQRVIPNKNSAAGTFSSYYQRDRPSSIAGGQIGSSVMADNGNLKYTKNPISSPAPINTTAASEMVMQRIPTLDPPNKVASASAVTNENSSVMHQNPTNVGWTTNTKSASALHHSSTESVKNLTQIAIMVNKSNDTQATMTKNAFNKNALESKYKQTVKPNHIFDAVTNSNTNSNKKYNTNNVVSGVGSSSEGDKTQPTVKPLNVEFLNDCITSFISNSMGSGSNDENDRERETSQSLSYNGNLGSTSNASLDNQHHHHNLHHGNDNFGYKEGDYHSSSTAGNVFSRDQNKYNSSSGSTVAASAFGSTHGAFTVSASANTWDSSQQKVTLPTSGEKQKENSHIYYYKLPPINSQPLKANANTSPTIHTSSTASGNPYSSTAARPATTNSVDKTYQKVTTLNRPTSTSNSMMNELTDMIASSTNAHNSLHTEARISSSSILIDKASTISAVSQDTPTTVTRNSATAASTIAQQENKEGSTTAFHQITDTKLPQIDDSQRTGTATKQDIDDSNSKFKSTVAHSNSISTKRAEPLATPQLVTVTLNFSAASDAAIQPTTPVAAGDLSDLRKEDNDIDNISVAIVNDEDDNEGDGADDDDDDEDDEPDSLKDQGAENDDDEQIDRENDYRHKVEHEVVLTTKNQRVANVTGPQFWPVRRKTTQDEASFRDRTRYNATNKNFATSNQERYETRTLPSTSPLPPQKNVFSSGTTSRSTDANTTSATTTTIFFGNTSTATTTINSASNGNTAATATATAAIGSTPTVDNDGGFVRVKLENRTTPSSYDSITTSAINNKHKDEKIKINLAKNQPPKQSAVTGTTTTTSTATNSNPPSPITTNSVNVFRSPGGATSTLARPPTTTAATWTTGSNSNSAAAPVELHPAPHENMGLEASVAYLGDDVKTFIDLCNELSFKIWTTQTGKSLTTSRSIVLSPFALLSTLAMIFLGARGSSSGIMNDFLRLDDMVTFNPHQVFRNITESAVNSKNNGAANVAFVRQVFSDKTKGNVLEFYKERLQQYYDTYVEEINFNAIGDLVRRRTNLLVKRQTQGRIQDYLRGSTITMKPPLATFTANIFQTDCSTASTEGRDGEMYFVVRPSTRQRRLVPIPAVVYRGGFLAGYEPGLDATAVTLSPESIISTILVLPGQQGQVAPGDGLARLEQRLLESSYRRGAWSRLLRSLLFRHGLEVQIPRFSHKSILNLTMGLQRMGMAEIFAPDKADLRGINGLLNELHLSDCVQANTFSTCGEESVGARHHVETFPSFAQRNGASRQADHDYDYDHVEHDSATVTTSTSVPVAAPAPLSSRPRQARLPDNPRLRFDRPFLYIVRHNPTGMILYIGRFNPRLLP